MRKSNYFFGSLIPLLFLFCVLGCRNENIYSENSSISQKEAILRQVNKRDIPNIMNFLATKTDDFKLPLKTTNALGKTETVFGEVDTNYIIESTNEKNEIYYVFSITPDVSDSKTYNLEIKSDGTIPSSAKIIVYYPTEDWILNGNGDFSIFSGRAYTYSLDGILETSVDFLRGAAGPCDPNPCPDCPTNPQGPGGGTGGGGGGPIGGESGPWNPGGGYGGGTSGGGGTGGGTGGGGGGCGDWIFSHNVFADGVLIGWMYVNSCGQSNFVSAFQNRLANPCGGGQVVVYTAPMYLNDVMNNLGFPLTPTENNFLNLYSNSTIANGLRTYLNNNRNQDGATFVKWAISFFNTNTNPSITWTEFDSIILNNKNAYESPSSTSIDIDNNTNGGYDTNTYDVFNPQQQSWPTIPNVIPINDFIGWGYPGVKRNCMDYAKVQIGKKGYQISNYGAIGQTFQIYREQTGVNNSNLINGLSYLKYALSNGIPVIVGVDDKPGHPGNADQSTDHFIVIIGMGSDNNGNYFSFYDNASGNSSLGTHPNNKLYYNSSTGIISGNSATSYASGLTYTITQIRKSKLK